MTRRPRRNHTPDSKTKVALAAVRGEQAFGELAQQYDVDPAVNQAWAVNPKHTNDRNRSITLELFRPIEELYDVTAYSLQVSENGEAIPVFGVSIVDLEPYLTNFSATAGAMNSYDFVVSVDISLLLEAGAIGCPHGG